MPLEISLKKSTIFTPQGTIFILVLLLFSLAFAILEKSGKIAAYSPKESPPVYQPEPLIFPQKYQIGFVTDAHAKASKKSILNASSEKPMEKFVSQMNTGFKPDFVMEGGDFIDGTRRLGIRSDNDFFLLDTMFQQIESPKYRVLGNHELRGFSRKSWTQKTNNKNSYYFFDYGERLRVIVFDSTLITSTLEEKSPKKIAYEKELAWLEETLQNSQNKRTIIFSHHPTVPILRKAIPLEIITRLNDLFSAYHVRAVFSGHVEVLYYEKIGGVDYFVAPGFYRSEATGFPWIGSFSELNIGLKNQLTLYYKKNKEQDEYQRLLVPSSAYYAVEKEERKTVSFLASPTEETEEKMEESELSTAANPDEDNMEADEDE